MFSVSLKVLLIMRISLGSYRSILVTKNVIILHLKLDISQSTAVMRESLRKLASSKFELVEEK